MQRPTQQALCLVGFVVLSVTLSQADGGRVQQVMKTQYVVAGERATLVCLTPALNNVLFWKFRANGSTTVVDAAQFFSGGKTTVFGQFDLPPGRSSLVGGSLTINQVAVPDEGEYWCEISQPGQASLIGDRFPLHVWVKPEPPKVIPLGNGTVMEFTATTIARCSSTAGRPVSKLSWWNGTSPLPGTAVVTRNSFSDRLWDVTMDLVLNHPTRFDHNRTFTCLVEHPAYKGEAKSLNHKVKVLYHPVDARVWANLTSLEVYCDADGYPKPTYYWVIPGGIRTNNTATLSVPDLYSLPGEGYIECRGDNGIPPAAVVRVKVDDLRWPDGKPVATFAGLAWYIWVGIGAGVLVVIIVIIVVVVCCCCKKKGKRSKTTGAKYSKPTLTSSGTRHSQPSLLEFDSLRTPDGRETSLSPPNDYAQSSMTRSYSLEHVMEEKYPPPARSSVMLVPLRDPSSDQPHRDSNHQRRASFDNIDQPTNHVEVLNRSWDNLVRSREDLNRSRDRLRSDLPPKYQSREDLRQQSSHSGAGDRGNYQPPGGDARDGRREPTNSYPNPDYYQHEIIPQYSYDDNHHGNQERDDRDYGAASAQGGYHDNRHNSQQYHHDNRSYEQSQYQGYGGSASGSYGGNHADARGYDDRNYGDSNYDNHDYNDHYHDNRGNYSDSNYNDRNHGNDPNFNDRNYGNSNYNDGNYGDSNYNNGNYGDSSHNDGHYGDHRHNDGGFDFQPSMI